MTLKEVIEVLRDLANRHTQIESFNTGLISEHNDTVIKYPALRLSFPYDLATDINAVNDYLTYTFSLSLLVNDVIENTGTLDRNVNTNYIVQQDNPDEIDTPLVDETLMRERALAIMSQYVEGLRMLEDEHDFFVVETYDIQSLERYANDYVTGVQINITIKVFNDYKCEAIANVNNSIWKDTNQSLLDISYIPDLRQNFYTQFDSVNESINLGFTDIIADGSTEVSYSQWIKCEPQADNAGIYSSYGGGANVLSPLIAVLTSGIIRFWLSPSAGTSFRNSSITIDDNEWHHICCVFKGSTFQNIYIDGVLRNGSMAGSVQAGTPASSFITSIGSANGTASFYGGGMDEVSVYDIALDASQVLTIFNKGVLNTDYSSLPGIKAHWHMDTLNPIDVIGGVNGTSVNMDASNIIELT